MSITATIIRECVDDYLLNRLDHDGRDVDADCAELVASILDVLDAATLGDGPMLILEDGSITRLGTVMGTPADTEPVPEQVSPEPYCTIFPINHDGPCSNGQSALASATA